MATVPLVIFISGFVASVVLERGKNIFGKRTAYDAGSLLAAVGCLWIKLGPPLNEDFTSRQIYGIAILIGKLNCNLVFLI